MIYDKTKEFILEFFKGSKIVDEKGVLNISEVPMDFENFLGKKSPYKLVFDFKLHYKIRDSELIMQGSYFLLAIKDYLSYRGKTSLLKIKIKPDLLKLNKNLAKNSNVLKIKPVDLNFLSEFSFLSSYQYLNEKKQSINKILIKDNKVLDLDINQFKSYNGNKEEIPNLNLNESYLIAKNKLNDVQADKINEIKLILREKMDKGIFRVKDHYNKQIKEKDEEVETCARKIKLLETKLKHTFYDRDISILKRQIRESKERLESLKKKGYRERLKTEEVFHVTDEVEKHVLSIKKSLINVTLYYYPIYNISVNSKGKTISIKYDPVFDKILSKKP